MHISSVQRLYGFNSFILEDSVQIAACSELVSLKLIELNIYWSIILAYVWGGWGSVSVDVARTLGLLFAQLRHVDFQTVGQDSSILLVVNKTVFLQLLIIVACIGVALNACLVVVLTFVAVGINVSIGAPRIE